MADMKIASVKLPRLRASGFDPSLKLVMALFALGIVGGAVVGSRFSPADLLPELGGAASGSLAPESLAAAFESAFLFLALALFFGTTYLGVFLLPSLALVRAYSLSCSVAALFAACQLKGLLCAFLSVGLPALAAVPCFLVLTQDALLSAKQLFSIRFYASPCGRGNPNFIRHLAVCLPLAAATALYSRFLLPHLLSLAA